MRPKYLEMSAWGPYKDVVKIDFDEFRQGALFLITGPTGSGKTTIFDGICFAIYGNTSGKEREKTTLRSDFALPEKDTYVHFVFTHNDLIYEVKRNPEYLRPKKRKNAEGKITYTTEKENAVLTMPDGSIISGTTTVNRKLQELMALDYNQFKQISMIAQGEFDRMLTAPSQEKTKIFRSIFGTERFDLFTQTLKTRSAVLYRKVSEYTHRMEEDIKIHAKGEAELEKSAAAEHLNYDEILQMMSERVAFYQKEKIKLSKELEEKEAVLLGAQSKYNDAMEQLKKKQQLAKAEEQYEKLQNTKEQYEAAKFCLQNAKEAQNISKDYEKCQEISKQCQKYAQESQRIAENVEFVRKQYIQAENLEKTAREVWHQADAAYRRAAIGIVADMLKEGEPCPVCGSIQHPQPFASDSTIPDLKEVERLKKAYEIENNKKMSVYGQVQALLEANRKARSDLENAQKDSVMYNKQWQNTLQNSTFKTEQTFLNAHLSKAAELKYEEKVKKWEEMVLKTKTVMEHLSAELAEVQMISEDEVLLAFQTARSERDAVRVLEQQVILKIQRLKEGINSLKENRVWAEKYRREYGVIKDLENMAVGLNSKRLVFEQYVLSSFFEDILAAANQRFRHMTMDRYEMIRKTEVSDARTKDHLDIMIVDYYTGKTRPVSTLSGGERFNASLSLALGMSDVIQAYQGGIQVEALFVDEGFGSLDEETLQAACDTLYQLTQGDKLVGIISHVDSLKQRIDNRIEICKTNMGSTLKVISQKCKGF